MGGFAESCDCTYTCSCCWQNCYYDDTSSTVNGLGGCGYAGAGGRVCAVQLKYRYRRVTKQAQKEIDDSVEASEKTRKKKRNRKVWGKERLENPSWARIPKMVKRMAYCKPGQRWRKG